ncbi:hypothetical protein BP6252_08411 [Coleophoma cylindrospora]|uniref:Aminotransferase class V domain-containing protein n=1 Tax=Coleophoma cylindrospora TaxID=1849047 RepID=A0A3D8R622_9HELO|nr:hypothetical protein BP6252_08411 [Coleophoma cylindrospora]
MGEVSIETLALHESTSYKPVPFGKEMRKQFLFTPEWTNINHGSFGASPKAVRDKQKEYQELCETRPDPFIRYTYPKLLDESRAAVAKLLNVPTSTCVFVPNATTGVNSILRNIVWNDDGKDEIVYFNTIYGACGKTIEYISEYSKQQVKGRVISLAYPHEDEDIVKLFKEAIAASRAEGKTPRAAVFDTISSQPGLRFPFESLVKICAEEGVLSVIDGAHGIGHIALDLTTIDPDFFTSNLHKWLYVPRGCAVLYVPERNQPMIRSPLPTSHGFVPQTKSELVNPLPTSNKSEFVNNFEFVGTIDNTNYLVAAEAIKWRQEVCGGEEAIMKYNIELSRKGAASVAKILNTNIIDNKTYSLSNCALSTLVLPIKVGDGGVNREDVRKATVWMVDTAMSDYKTFIPFLWNSAEQKWWIRLSAQIYLDIDDFEYTGKILKELCERVEKGEYLTAN